MVISRTQAKAMEEMKKMALASQYVWIVNIIEIKMGSAFAICIISYPYSFIISLSIISLSTIDRPVPMK